MQAAVFFLWVLYYARRKNFPAEPATPMSERWRMTLHAIPAMLVPAVVLGGIYGGVMTVTESAAMAAVTALFVSLVVYRGLRYPFMTVASLMVGTVWALVNDEPLATPASNRQYASVPGTSISLAGLAGRTGTGSNPENRCAKSIGTENRSTVVVSSAS